MKKQSFIAGALIVSVGGIAAKLFGALYRIPLSNLLGGEGMGIYQMVYPFYCLLLTLSATGIPSGLARIVARLETEGGAAASRTALEKALFLFCAVGLGGSLIMFAAAPLMSALQNEPSAAAAYRMLAPSVFAVAAVSCFRGYFQGRGNFLPTALSEIFEQIVKVGLGLFFAYTYRGDAPRAVAYTLLAVTASETAAAVFMLACGYFSRAGGVKPLYRERPKGEIGAAPILRFILPVAVSAGILPLSNLLDSILIVRLIGKYSPNATALYGVFAGGAATLVNLPVSVCYGLAAAIVPLAASLYAKGRAAEAEKKIAFALKCTLFVSVPSAAFLFAFPSETAALLFRSVQGEEGVWLVRLIRIMSVGAVLLSAVQTLSACLTGRGKPKIAAACMSAAVAVKIILELILLRIPEISISGAAIATICCYFVALIGDLLYSVRDKKLLARTGIDFLHFAAAAAVSVGAAYPLRFAGAILPLAVTGAAYLALCLLTKCFSREELGLFGRLKNNDHRNRAGVLPRRSHGCRKGRDPVGR